MDEERRSEDRRTEAERNEMLVIRMRRAGSKKRPFFRVVVAEQKNAREGSFVEVLGHYNPRTTPETLELDRERLAYWIKAGAQPSDSVRTLIARAPDAAAPAPSAPAGQPAAS
jgi:small subunit ribosomal protein S16